MLWMRLRHPEALRDLGTGLLLVLILLAGLFVGTSQYLWAPRQGPESNPWYFFFFTVDRFNSKLLLPWVSGWLHKCLCIFGHCTTLSSSSGQPYTHGASHYKLVRHSRRPSWDVWIGLTDLYIWGCFSEKGVGKSSSLFHVAEVLSPVPVRVKVTLLRHAQSSSTAATSCVCLAGNTRQERQALWLLVSHWPMERE